MWRKSNFSWALLLKEKEEYTATEKSDDDIQLERPEVEGEEEQMNMGGESKIEEPKVVVGEETKVGVSRNFSQSWLSIFPWLSFETEKQMMFCTVCLKDGVAKNLFTRGCNNFLLLSLHVHNTQTVCVPSQ